MLRVGIHQEFSLNIDFGIHNERQDYKAGTVEEHMWDEGEWRR
jgi:hypothetical protein